MDQGSWDTLSRLLDEALELPSDDLPRWIETLPPEYDALKPRLRSLLSRMPLVDSEDFLRTLPKVDATGRAEKPGDQIGNYRLLRELGSGGMGVVWLAERTDVLVKRQVALKLPHGAWKRAGLAERMAREREILATLAHPNIAHLYDAGVTPEGQPYLAIEYVEGVRIDAYCQEHDLDVNARLRLFAQVGHAVAFAHNKLVVHRDLKPANILVTADGQARLLDFGIAKLLDDGQVRETQVTAISGRAMTPDYASPEQIVGEPLTIRSDVYSLGVILYELLSGQRPYKLRRDTRGALEDAIMQTEPPLPSAVARPELRKRLRGDLDLVVMKALKKSAAERYATVHALLDDVERHLTSRPVLAQPDTRWYRARKFAARNRLAVGASGAILLAVLAGAGIAAWQARVALAQKSRAERVQTFIASLFREADPYQKSGQVLSAAELLRQAERRLHERADADPAMQLELLAIIGESLFGLQENAEAARIAEQALRLPSAQDEENALSSARLHLTLAHAYELLGRSEEAQTEAQRALARLTAADLTATPTFARAKLQQSALAIVLADYVVAEKTAHEAIGIASRTLGPGSLEVAKGHNQLSHLYTLTQRQDLAVDSARRGYDILLDLHARNLNHPVVIEAGQYYGLALDSAGRFEEAARVYRDATARAGNVFGLDSRVYGEMLNSSVSLAIEIGDLTFAIPQARRMIEIYLIEGEPGSITHIGRKRLLGNALLAARKNADAVVQLEEVVSLAVTAKSALHERHARGSLGLALAYQGRFDRAERELTQAIGTPGKEIGGGQLLAIQNLGTSLRLQGRYAEALPWLEKAMEAASTKYGRRGYLAHGLLQAGLAKLELGESEAAREYFSRAETLFADVQKHHTTPARAELYLGTARALMQDRKQADALPLLEKANAFWLESDPENHTAGEAALWLGRCQDALGQHAQARAAFARAERLLAASPIPAEAALAKLARPH